MFAFFSAKGPQVYLEKYYYFKSSILGITGTQKFDIMKHFLLQVWCTDDIDHGTAAKVCLSKLLYTKLCLILRDSVGLIVSVRQIVKMLSSKSLSSTDRFIPTP